jgi:hypothetical protein
MVELKSCAAGGVVTHAWAVRRGRSVALPVALPFTHHAYESRDGGGPGASSAEKGVDANPSTERVPALQSRARRVQRSARWRAARPRLPRPGSDGAASRHVTAGLGSGPVSQPSNAQRDLIPIAVRIALRNAVGGSGPYTLREIDDLFNSHGFVEYDSDVADVGGDRRMRAEGYHVRVDFSSSDDARRYLDLVDEVLELWPEESSDPRDAGQRLQRELRRAEIVRDATGRLQLPGAELEAGRKLEQATEGVWLPDRIRVFVSHTHPQRQTIAALAHVLDGYGFSCFVAHDDIEPSREWQDVIELALNTCDVLIAYVTADFSRSDWTDQEVGWALGRELVVIPVRAGADPYGFFGSYQGVPVTDSIHGSAVAIARAIAIAVFNRQRPGATRLLARMADLIVDAFCGSQSFDIVRERFELLRLIPKQVWTPDHFARLDEAACENNQIENGVILRPERQAAADAIAALRESVGV